MADNNSGDKTEKPTPKKIRDARKKGDVAKSRDLTGTLALVLWMVLFGLLLTYSGERLFYLMDLSFTSTGADFTHLLSSIGGEAIKTLLILSAIFMIPVIIFSLLVEFLQVGPLLTFDKVKPKLDKLNIVSGTKRMFGMDNLVEVIKHIVKTALLFLIAWLVIKQALPELLLLPTATPEIVGSAIWSVVLQLFAWTIGIFVVIAIADALYQRHSHMKKLRMSHSDIKQEYKQSEGDPMIKQKRREAHQEWSQQSASQAAGDANVVVVNPTHIAIALNHDRQQTPIPIVSAKGQNHMAKAMRKAAEEAGVPILRNERLARELLKKCDEGDIVPKGLFDIIAEVILWAEDVRDEIHPDNVHQSSSRKKGSKKQPPPGEDLSRYPDNIHFQRKR